MIRPIWLIQTSYQSASSRVTETTFFDLTCFQKCFSVENLIIVSLNTVIPIIFIVYWLLDVSINGLFIAIQCLLLFNVVFQVMHTVY